MRSLWSRMWKQPSTVVEELQPASNRYADQLERGFWWLRFFDDLEREYQRGFMGLNARSIRVAQLLGVLGILTFIALDHLALQLLPPRVYQVLGLVSIPAMLVPFLAAHQQRGSINLQRISFASTLLLGLSIIWVIWYGEKTIPDHATEAVLVLTMYLYFLSGLLWTQTVVCGLSTWVAFLLPGLMHGHPPDLGLVYDGFYVGLANAIGMVGRYVFEYQDRRQFLMRLELRHLAENDGLTGLLNRRAFGHHAQVAWALASREHKSVSLLILDLDFLKVINDRHGHLTGDDCLREVAEALRHLTRRPLDAASRFGGDEFVALWYDADPEWIELLQGLLQQQLRLRGGLAAKVESLGVTGGGVRCWPSVHLSFNDALAAADDQLYGGKERGRGVITWSQLAPRAAGTDAAEDLTGSPVATS
ncbi:MAG: GGDEF domain-containing protein [Stagnimonas sp.]|nr:GGDEF domain-containing protein [Stagnimonas sp.]